MQTLVQDLRYGFRLLRKNRSFSAIAILTLALGIGANTTIFSAINALLLGPLPVEDDSRLVYAIALREGFDPFGTSLLEFNAYRRQSTSFISLGIGARRSFNVIGRDHPERVPGGEVGAAYLNTLGVAPMLGHGFTAEEDRVGGPGVALISYDLWQRHFGGERNILGQTINLEGRPRTITGVMPAGFDVPAGAEIWVPMQIDSESLPLSQSTQGSYETIARLKPNVTLEQADAELKGIAENLAREYPQYRQGWTVKLITLRQLLIDDLSGRTHKALYALVVAVGFLLLICCANVTNLIMAHGVAREREIAIRQALGASSWRLARQMMTESLVLAGLGGFAGVLVAYWTGPLLVKLSPIEAIALSATFNNVRLDTKVLLFAFLTSLLAGVMVSLLPVLKNACKDQLMTLIKQRELRVGAAAGRRWLSAIVITEIAVAVTLLAGGSLMLKSFQRLQRLDLGFRPENLLSVRMDLTQDRYQDHTQRVMFLSQTLERIRAIPGVNDAGATTNLPLSHSSLDMRFTVEGQAPLNPAEVPITAARLVTPGYMQTLGVELISGRFIDERDRADSHLVVVVSEELARQAWPNADPIGKRIRRGTASLSDFPWMTVVGVVKDVKEDRANFRINRPVWYLPYTQHQLNLPVNLLLRANVDPSSLTESVRTVVRELDSNQPISEPRSMKEHVAGVIVTERFSAMLLIALACIGLLVAALGLYGVMAYAVTQRTGEIGLRMALGATSSDAFRMVLGQGARLIGIGLTVGVSGAMLVTRLLKGVLYNVGATDPVTFVVVALLLTFVGLVACYIPARRASRMDPMLAIRQD
jgi:putative ABC transport system permease protein